MVVTNKKRVKSQKKIKEDVWIRIKDCGENTIQTKI